MSYVLLSLGSSPTFAASTLLEACWTAQQLISTAAENRIQKNRADHTPPAYDRPHVSLTARHDGQSIRAVALPENAKVIALTFDLCEQANEISGYDGQIVDYLRQQQVKTTFFAGGKWLRDHSERAKQLLADPLFELGNHTWTHGNLRTLPAPAVEQQIRWTQVQYEILRDELLNASCAAPFKTQAALRIAAVPEVFRFPYGTCNRESLNAVSQYGLAAVQWNIVSGDPDKNQSATAIANSILNNVKAGSIIVAHANGRGWHTAQALPRVISELRRRGYEFVKVSELLNMGTPITAATCYENKPNDNQRYDKILAKTHKPRR